MSENHDDTIESISEVIEVSAADSTFEAQILPEKRLPVEQVTVDMLPLDGFSSEDDLPEFIPNHRPEVRFFQRY